MQGRHTGRFCRLFWWRIIRGGERSPLSKHRGDYPQRVLSGVLFGLAVVLFGLIAIVQIQVEPVGTTPTVHEWYPVLASGVAALLVTGSALFGLWKWPTRPQFTALGVVPGLWVGYPALMPNNGYHHPLGYLLVCFVPVVLGSIVWHDVRPLVRSAAVSGLSRRVGVIVAGMFGVFFLFSAGLVPVNPEQGVNSPTGAFVISAEFANPLVLWPAVEFYLPSIPLAGAMSIGTAILLSILVGLIGLDATLLTAVWQQDLELSSSGGLFGGLATTGATACCCCGPAVYAIASTFFGVSASPLYWAFMDPASPLGALFFVGAVLLLTGSSVRLARSLNDAGIGVRPDLPRGTAG